MSHGTMKYTLKAHVCYFALMVGLLHYLYSLHADFLISENIININNGPTFFKLFVRVRIYYISICI